MHSIYLTGRLEDGQVPLAKKDCDDSLLALLNDQYADGGVWSIDDKDWMP